MTYCLGMLLDEGLVMVADTRTNAGVDNVSSYRKLHCLADGPDREIYAATSGNLSASQIALERFADGAGLLLGAESMFEAAGLVGEALREANRSVIEAMAPATMKGTSCLLLGGRVGIGPPRLFQIYQEGNFIECKRDAPFLQIGETKYGRPILDRVIRRSTPLPTAVKTALLSFDSAMRSNLSVARPLDLVVMPADAAQPRQVRRIEADDEYFNTLSARWSQALNEATMAMPDPCFMQPEAPTQPDRIVAHLRR
jgi:putative proteasome-type protease